MSEAFKNAVITAAILLLGAAATAGAGYGVYLIVLMPQTATILKYVMYGVVAVLAVAAAIMLIYIVAAVTREQVANLYHAVSRARSGRRNSRTRSNIILNAATPAPATGVLLIVLVGMIAGQAVRTQLAKPKPPSPSRKQQAK